MAQGFAQAVLLGSYGDQEVQNTLWYRYENDVPGGEETIPNFVAQLESVVLAKWAAMSLDAYLISGCAVQLFSAAWEPRLITPLSVSLEVNGELDASSPGVGACAIINFHPAVTGGGVPAGHVPVRRSYLALGPIAESAISDVGGFDPTVYGATAGSELLTALASSLGSLDIWGETTPIRVGAADGLGVRSYIAVASASFRGRASFRRSRNN